MDVRDLTVFAAVAENGSFTHGAAQLGMAQSAVSQTIRDLESELKVELFDRTHRQIRLSGAGEALVPYARKVLDAVDNAKVAMSRTRGTVSGSVRVGVMTSVVIVDLPDILERFHAQYPEVKVHLISAPSGSGGLLQELQRGRVDIALAVTTGSVPVEMHGSVIATSEFVLVVPEYHRLAGSGSVSLRDVYTEPFVDVPTGFGSRRITDSAFGSLALNRNVQIEVAEIDTAVDYVQHGLGLALLPEFTLRGRSGVSVLNVVEEIEPFKVWALTRSMSHTSPAAEALQRLLIERGQKDR